MNKEDEEMVRFIIKVGCLILEIFCISIFVGMAIYIFKSTIGIDLFPGWSLFH